jgi:alkanesulfonate monooxygenase SsuD/methylene tetrahydromethanopterin reductase-like flavin-dependent oxidoreductase (luciferase family)
MKLWKKHGTTPRYARIPDNFEAAVSNRAAIVGSPATIRDAVYRMAEEAGVSYFIVQFSFGDLTHEEVKRSAMIFAREVIPSAQDHLARVS